LTKKTSNGIVERRKHKPPYSIHCGIPALVNFEELRRHQDIRATIRRRHHRSGPHSRELMEPAIFN
jgi:hypothetical protein